jgi:hypothetical protein
MNSHRRRVSSVPASGPSLGDWLERRDVVHHDWLLNRFLMLLEARHGTLVEMLAGRRPIDQTTVDSLAEWNLRLTEMRRLVEKSQDALTPAQLVDEYPLCRLAARDRQVVARAAHDAYLARPQVARRREELLALLETADAEVRAMLTSFSNGQAGTRRTADPSAEDRVRRMRDACAKLAGAISSLPREAEVV